MIRDEPKRCGQTVPPMPLAAADFGPMHYRGVRFYEDEEGDIWAHGHVPPEEMVAAIGEFFADVSAPAFDLVPPDPSAVQHCYAVRADGPPRGDEGPYMSVHGITAETPGAIPVTYVPV